jgi:hypothetical protein
MTHDLPRRQRQRWSPSQRAALSLAYVGYATCMLCKSAVDVAVPAAQQDPTLALGHAATARMLSAGNTAYTLGKLVGGAATDTLGGARMLAVTSLVTGGAFAVISQARSLGALIAAWSFARLFMAAGYPAGTAICDRNFRPEEGLGTPQQSLLFRPSAAASDALRFLLPAVCACVGITRPVVGLRFRAWNLQHLQPHGCRAGLRLPGIAALTSRRPGRAVVAGRAARQWCSLAGGGCGHRRYLQPPRTEAAAATGSSGAARWCGGWRAQCRRGRGKLRRD